MDENILHDLLRKIANTVRDFSLEHDIPGLVDVSVDANRIIVDVKERALGGPVIGGLPYDISAGTEMYVPAPAGTFAPNESIYPMGDQPTITIHANDAAGGTSAADVFGDRLKEALSNRPARKGPPNDPLKDRKGI